MSDLDQNVARIRRIDCPASMQKIKMQHATLVEKIVAKVSAADSRHMVVTGPGSPISQALTLNTLTTTLKAKTLTYQYCSPMTKNLVYICFTRVQGDICFTKCIGNPNEITKELYDDRYFWSCFPFSAIKCLKQLAHKNEDESPVKNRSVPCGSVANRKSSRIFFPEKTEFL